MSISAVESSEKIRGILLESYARGSLSRIWQNMDQDDHNYHVVYMSERGIVVV